MSTSFRSRRCPKRRKTTLWRAGSLWRNARGPEVLIHREDDPSFGLRQRQKVLVGTSPSIGPRPPDVVPAASQGLYQPPRHVLVGKQARHWGQLRRLTE